MKGPGDANVEEKYRQLLEDINDGCAVLQDGIYVFTNKKFSEIFGYKPGQLLGKSYVNILAPDNRNEMIELYEKTVRGEVPPLDRFESEAIKADGTKVFIEASINPIQYEGKPAFSMIVRDITRNKQAEEALKESQELYRSLVETADKAGEGIVIAQNIGNLEGVLVFVNDEFSRITGYTSAELASKTFKDLFPPDSLTEPMDRYRRRRDGEEMPYYYETPLIRKDGTTVPVEYCAGLTIYQGNLSSIAYVRDTTERNRAEEKYRQLLEDMKDGYAVIQDGEVTFANGRFCEIFGYEPGQELGHDITEFIAPEDLKKTMELYTNVLNGKEVPPERLELMGLKVDGTTLPIQGGVRPIEYDGKSAFSIIVRDITDRKESEKKYRQLLEDLKDGYAVIQDGKIAFANGRLCEIFGYEPGQEIGLDLSEFIAQDDLAQVMDIYTKVLNGKEEPPERFELMAKKRDGTVFPVQSGARYIEYDGKPAFSAIVRDITERKESEEKYRQLLEDMKDGYIAVQDRKLVFANKRFCEIFGCDPGQEIGRDIAEFFHPDNVQEIMELYTNVINGEKEPPERIELVAMKRNGIEFPIQAGVRPIEYDGKPAHSVIIRDITEHKRMQDELRESREMYKSMVETAAKAGEGIGIVQNVGNTEGAIVFANDELLRITGYTREELIAKTFLDIMLPDSLAEWMELYRRRQAGEELPGYTEIWLLRKDGTTVPVECGAGITTYQGKVATISYIRDISQRKQAEEAQREMEQRFRAIFDNAMDGICLADIETRQFYTCNNVFSQMLDYKLEDIRTMRVNDIHSEQDLPYVLEQFDKQTRGEITIANDIPVQRRDGSIFYTDVNSSLLTIGGKMYLIGIFRDITERKEKEEALRESQEMYMSLVETADKAGEGIMIVQNIGNADGIVVFANDEVLRVTGYTREEIIGCKIEKLISSDEISETIDRYRRRQAGEEFPSTYEIRAIRKDGKLVPVEYCVTLVTYQGNVASIAYLRDITERKNAEEMLQKSQEKLQSILYALPDILLHISRDGTLLDKPMGHNGIFGEYLSESPVKTLYDVLPSDYVDRALRAIETTLNKGIPQIVEHTIPALLRTDDIYETRIVPFGGDEVLAISRNITDQKLSEKRLHTYQQQLKSLTSQLSQTEERERRRLAADLHDLIGQSLAVIKMKVSTWKNTLYSSGNANAMREVLELIESTINNTRSLTLDLSPPVLYELGLEAGLESLLEQFHKRHAIQYEFKDDGQEKPLGNEVRILLYRCASELLMNVIKHSRAHLVKLSIYRENNQISITIADDGVGFAVQDIEDEVRGFGLLSIRERLNWIGGSFKLQSKPGCGTHAALIAPIMEYADENEEND